MSYSTYHHVLLSPLVGGAARVAMEIARELSSSGVKNKLWFPGEGAALQTARSCFGLDADTYPLTSAMSSRPWQAIYGNAFFWRRLRRDSVVHVHSPVVYGALSRGLAASNALRVVHIHSEADLNSIEWAFRSPPDLVISCASYLEQRLQASSGLTLRSTTIPNPVELTACSSGSVASLESTGCPTGKPRLLMLANLSPLKGQLSAIQALATPLLRDLDAQLLLAGEERPHDKGFELQLRQLAAELKVDDRVWFLGFRDDCADLLRAADMLLLPSHTEGMPLTILEAQACGTPVIATPVGGIPEIIIDGVSGLLVEIENVEMLADRIASVLRDGQLRARLSENGRRQVEQRHSIEKYCRDLSQQIGMVREDDLKSPSADRSRPRFGRSNSPVSQPRYVPH